MNVSQVRPVVSVIIPVYNRKEQLARTLISVLNQTYQKFEVLVIDDFSTDNPEEVISELNDDRIKYYRLEKKGNANVARNLGIRKAKGEYIAMLDSDDEFLPHHLERRLQKIKEWGCDGIFGSAKINYDKGSRVQLSRDFYEDENMLQYLLSDGFAPTPSHFYKSFAVREVLWNEKLKRNQDFDFSIRFAKKFAFFPDYEPTIVIDWKENRSNKNQEFDSMIEFLNIHKNDFTPLLFKKRIFELYKLSLKASNGSNYVPYFRKELFNLMDYLSYTEFSRLRSKGNLSHSIINRASFVIKFLINTING